jgi:hypothetical protein
VKSKLPCEAKQNNLPPECGQPIDGASADKIHAASEMIFTNLLILQHGLCQLIVGL